MPDISDDEKITALNAFEKAIRVGTPMQIGRLWGECEAITWMHEEREPKECEMCQVDGKKVKRDG